MKLLALDTSTDACSVALRIAGETQMDFRIAPRQHTDIILGMIEELLKSADLSLTQLDAIAFGRGPGAFTGLRIAAGVVQGLAFGAQLPVAPVSSLAALAQAASDRHGVEQILAVMDARMHEVYCACYQRQNDVMVLQDEEIVIAPAKLQLPQVGAWFGAGSGFAHYHDELGQRARENLAGVDDSLLPDAAAIAQLAEVEFKAGNVVSAEQALPVYIRDNVAVKPVMNKPV